MKAAAKGKQAPKVNRLQESEVTPQQVVASDLAAMKEKFENFKLTRLAYLDTFKDDKVAEAKARLLESQEEEIKKWGSMNPYVSDPLRMGLNLKLDSIPLHEEPYFLVRHSILLGHLMELKRQFLLELQTEKPKRVKIGESNNYQTAFLLWVKTEVNPNLIPKKGKVDFLKNFCAKYGATYSKVSDYFKLLTDERFSEKSRHNPARRYDWESVREKCTDAKELRIIDENLNIARNKR